MEILQKKSPFIQQYYGWIILAVLAGVYAPLIMYWYDGWLNKSISIEHEYFSHGLIGLPFAAYIAWSDRKAWLKLPDKTHPLGSAFLVLGTFFYLTGLPDFVNLSFPIILAGIGLWLKGMNGFKFQGFPLLLVLLATPTQVPYLIAPYIIPLQSFIAATAGFILLQFNINVRVEDIYLYVNDAVVEVAPHCSGLKMLLTSLYVALMLLYWRDDLSSKLKINLFLISVVVVSVVGNIIRNTLLTFFHGTGNEPLFHWLHESWGGDFYSACMLALLIPLLTVIENIAEHLAIAPEHSEEI
jgi:cyanoexosortase B